MAHSFVIEPGTYNAFENEAAEIEQCKEWGLLSEKATKTKPFYYKGSGLNIGCRIIGYVDKMTAVIELDSKQLHCIHPSYLKEMQASNYGQKISAAADESAETDGAAALETQQADTTPEEAAKKEAPKADEQPKEKAKKEKAQKQKLELPEEKIKMTATVKQFTTVPNHFSDTEDEVIIYEAVALADPATEIGAAWSSYSATLKKLELEVGDTLTFEGKIIAKKLTKHPVPYKINNPSKIEKTNP